MVDEDPIIIRIELKDELKKEFLALKDEFGAQKNTTVLHMCIKQSYKRMIMLNKYEERRIFASLGGAPITESTLCSTLQKLWT